MATTHFENIAVVGASGQVGAAITNALLQQGKHNVTAISRPESKSTMPPGLAAVRTAAYDNHSALVEALSDQDVLIISLNPAQGIGNQSKLVDAAIEAGVRYIIPNEYGNDRTKLALAKDTLIGNMQLDMRAYIEKAGGAKTHWIAISCGFWYDHGLAGSPIRFGFDIMRRQMAFWDQGTAKITVTTRAQCAQAVALLLALPPTSSDGSPSLRDWNNKPLYTGDFTISQQDMFQAVLKATDTKTTDWTITHQDSHKTYDEASRRVQSGDFSAFEPMLYSCTFFPEDPGAFESKLQNKLIGLPVVDLDTATREAVKTGHGSD